VRILAGAIGKEGMAGGQALDLEFAGDRDVIEAIHLRKTAALIEATLLAAAEVIGLDDAARRLLSEAGRAIGVAFQLADDLLDCGGDENLAGKRLRKDGRNRSPNAALHFGIDVARGKMAERHRSCRERIGRLGIDHPPFVALLDAMVNRSR
jgi:geranylgeranyl pyrophosphate synthase